MKNAVTLRPYRPHDLDAIFHLDELCFDPPFRFSRASMRRFAEASHAIAVVAEAKHAEIVAFVILHLERTVGGKRAYVVTLDVSPQERRAGLAGLLMDTAEQRGRGAGAQTSVLHVFTENLAAIRFYEARGYQRVGVAKSFYGAANRVPMDAYLYRKDLGDT